MENDMRTETSIGKIRVNLRTVEKSAGLNKFAMQQLVKSSGTVEFMSNGEWSTIPPQRVVEGKRLIFPSLREYSVAKNTYNAWSDLEAMQFEERTQQQPREKPEFPETAFQRLLLSRQTQQPTTLFVPWGVRPTGKFGDMEEAVLDRLARVRETLSKNNIPNTLLLMPADLYATEINSQVSADQSTDYFLTVTEKAQARDFLVRPWSELRDEFWQDYVKLSTFLTDQAILNSISSNKFASSLKAASRRSGYSDDVDIQNAAFAYIRERICEAEILEKEFQPIKISVVPKNKDNEVDRILPRLYMIPPAIQMPWLK